MMNLKERLRMGYTKPLSTPPEFPEALARIEELETELASLKAELEGETAAALEYRTEAITAQKELALLKAQSSEPVDDNELLARAICKHLTLHVLQDCPTPMQVFEKGFRAGLDAVPHRYTAAPRDEQPKLRPNPYSMDFQAPRDGQVETLRRDAENMILLGEYKSDEEGVVWYGKNPHAFAIGTKFYALLDAARKGEE